MAQEHYLKTELYAKVQHDREIFEFLQSGALDGIWYWDLMHPEHEWMSSRFWEVLGYDPAEQAHSPNAWHDIINRDDLQRAKAAFVAHCEDPALPYDLCVRYQHKDGHTVWVRCRGAVIRDDDDDTPVRMLGAHTDVTAHVTVNAEIKEFLSEIETSVYADTFRAACSRLRAAADSMAEEVTGLVRETALLKSNRQSKEG